MKQSVQPSPVQNAASLEPLRRLVQPELEKVNDVILDSLQSEVDLIPDLAKHLIQAGGKRLRPVLTIAAAKLCGYEGQRHINLAAVVEFIHTATLLHDDVVDASRKRRGQSTANELWGNKPSVLVGDFLFSRSFELMTADGSLDVLRILSRASAVIAEGEVKQLTTANNLDTTEADYFQVISSKTACLFAAATEIGAVVAEQPETTQTALREFGMNFGIAYQIIDDLLDYQSPEETLGKASGNDMQEGKMTLPIILAYNRSSSSDQQIFKRIFVNLEQTPDDFAWVCDKIKSTKADVDSANKARDYSNNAIENLQPFSSSALKNALIEMVEYGLERLS